MFAESGRHFVFFLILFPLFTSTLGVDINILLTPKCLAGIYPEPLIGNIQIYQVPSEENIVGENATVPSYFVSLSLLHNQSFVFEETLQDSIAIYLPAGAWDAWYNDEEEYNLSVVGGTNCGGFVLNAEKFREQRVRCRKENNIRCEVALNLDIHSPNENEDDDDEEN